MSTLKTNYKDYVASGDPKYRVTPNADGTSGIEDVTTYSQTGDRIGAADMNATNKAVLANAAGIEAESSRAQAAEQALSENLAFVSVPFSMSATAGMTMKAFTANYPAGYHPIGAYFDFATEGTWYVMAYVNAGLKCVVSYNGTSNAASITGTLRITLKKD